MRVDDRDQYGRNCVCLVYLKLRELLQKQIDYYELQFLKQLGADCDQRCLGGKTMLQDAAYRGREELFKCLLAIGCDSSLECSKGYNLPEYIAFDYQEQLSSGSIFFKSDQTKQNLLNHLGYFQNNT